MFNLNPFKKIFSLKILNKSCLLIEDHINIKFKEHLVNLLNSYKKLIYFLVK